MDGVDSRTLPAGTWTTDPQAVWVLLELLEENSPHWLLCASSHFWPEEPQKEPELWGEELRRSREQELLARLHYCCSRRRCYCSAGRTGAASGGAAGAAASAAGAVPADWLRTHRESGLDESRGEEEEEAAALPARRTCSSSPDTCCSAARLA